LLGQASFPLENLWKSGNLTKKGGSFFEVRAMTTG